VAELDGQVAGFVVEQTRTGPLVGNEAFTATGHIMVRSTT
jgi:hypothetical protein